MGWKLKLKPRRPPFRIDMNERTARGGSFRVESGILAVQGKADPMVMS